MLGIDAKDYSPHQVRVEKEDAVPSYELRDMVVANTDDRRVFACRFVMLRLLVGLILKL